MRLDIESLRAFRLTTESGGVTRAAQSLNLSQSAVSHKIKRLEERIGHPLFMRHEGPWQLTEEGKNLLIYASRILSLHDEAVSRLKVSSIGGEIRLGATEDITLSGLTPFLNRFSNQHPHTQLSVKVELSLVLQEWLQQDKLDIALLQIETKDVEKTDLLLWEDELVWIGAEDREWSQIDPLPLITFGNDCFYQPLFANALQSAKRNFRTVLECPSHSVIFSAVASGLGVSIINRRSMPAHVVALSPEALGPLPKIAYVARRTAGPMSEAMETLLDGLPELLPLH